MTHKNNIRWLSLIAIFIIASLACNLVGGIIEDQIDKTVETQVEALTTDIDSIITEVDLEAISTEINPEEIITQVGDLLPPEGTSAPLPEDIPVMPGNEELFSTTTSIEFVVQKTIKEVADFYEKEMPLKGWTKVAAESKVEAEATTLVFTKDNRKVTIRIEEDLFGGTLVTIAIVTS